MQRTAIVLVCLVGFAMSSVATASAQTIDFEYDWRAAKRIVQVLGQPSISDAQIKELMALPGVQATIRKNQQFSRYATDSMFVASLRAAIAGQPSPPNDAFLFPAYKARLPRVKELLAVIEPLEASIEDTVEKRLAPWLPGGVSLKIPTVITFGGRSAGWARADTQYIGLHAFGGAADYHAMVGGAVHEAFHVVQHRIMPEIVKREEGKPIANVLRLLVTTVMEGTAAYLSDPSKLPSDGDYIQWEQQYYRKNFNRLASNFVMLETLVFRARNDPNVDVDQLDAIGFTSQWDSPGYFVGHRMTEQIVKYDGVPAITVLLQQPAPRFFQRYMELYRAHPDDQRFIKFSATMEGLLNDVMR